MLRHLWPVTPRDAQVRQTPLCHSSDPPHGAGSPSLLDLKKAFEVHTCPGEKKRGRHCLFWDLGVRGCLRARPGASSLEPCSLFVTGSQPGPGSLPISLMGSSHQFYSNSYWKFLVVWSWGTFIRLGYRGCCGGETARVQLSCLAHV